MNKWWPVKIYDPAQRTFSADTSHRTQPIEGADNPCKIGIKLIRDRQAAGVMRTDYGFVVETGAIAWCTEVPPYIHLCYIVVPRDQPAYYHHGLDSMLHIDWRNYMKWFQADTPTGFES